MTKTVAQLKAEAKALKIPRYSKMRKAELIEAIAAHEEYDPADNSAKCYSVAIATMRDKLQGFRREVIGDCTLYLGDCLEVLPLLPKVDAVITDPPYSSGGQFRGDRAQKTSSKYVQTDSVFTTRDEFAGDTRDQRAFLAWSTMWFSKLLQISNDGAVLCAFTDWRQLPTMTDAVQCGGWIWRNVVTWWKPGIRMQRGRFSSSAEYLVYASHGIPIEGEKSPQNVLSFAPVGGEEKDHIAEKPVALLSEIVSITLPGATVLDPFMGSGTTGVACAKMGRKFIGVDIEPRYFDIACRRIEQAYKQPDFFVPRPSPPVQLGMLEAAE